MYQNLLSSASLYELLLKLDQDLADEARERGCSCGNRLHSAFYPRKPRGVPRKLEEAYSRRASFCCAQEGCRKRTTPPSFRFLSRRVYASVVVVLMTALRHGATPARVTKLRAIVGVSRRTVERWRKWWLEDFTLGSFWRSARGRLASPVDKRTLPLSMLEAFVKPAAKERTVDLLRFILPLTTASCRQET